MKILARTSFSLTLLIICRSLGIKSVAIYIISFLYHIFFCSVFVCWCSKVVSNEFMVGCEQEECGEGQDFYGGGSIL